MGLIFEENNLICFVICLCSDIVGVFLTAISERSKMVRSQVSTVYSTCKYIYHVNQKHK